MDIQPFSPTDLIGTNPTGTTTGATDVLGQDDFLLLLVTQLNNQDPLNPLDGQEFAAQLAQFSTLEQLISIDDTLTGNSALMGALNDTTNAGIAAGLIGKDIEAQGNLVSWSGGDAVPISFDLGATASSVRVTIRDASGNVVRTLDAGGRARGDNVVEWDGKNSDGTTVSDGVYSFEIEANDADDFPVSATSLIKGTVDRVTFGTEGIQLWIGEVPVLLGSVSSIHS